MSEAKVMIVGHSYVRDLESFIGGSFAAEGTRFRVSFYHKKGASYRNFLQDEEFFQRVRRVKPHFVIVILAGNSISHPKNVIARECEEFYGRLRYSCPNSTVISAQVELRFYQRNNRWNAPSGRDYDSKRNWINDLLRRNMYSDGMLVLEGRHGIDDRSLYRDFVHLNQEGLSAYFAIIRRELSYHMRAWQ